MLPACFIFVLALLVRFVGALQAWTEEKSANDVGEDPYCEPHSFVRLDKLTSSNLYSLGPDHVSSPAIVFADVIDAKGTIVDLEIRATSPYTPQDSITNGLHEQMGQINVMTGASVDLNFRFVNRSTGSDFYVAHPFYFSFGIDMASEISSAYVTLAGCESFEVASDTDLNITEIGGRTTFAAGVGEYGYASDVAITTNLDRLTPQALQRVVTVRYPAGSNFEATIGAMEEPNAKRTLSFAGLQARLASWMTERSMNPSGANFFFGGPSNLVCPVRARCDTLTCPSGFELNQDASKRLCMGEQCAETSDTTKCCCASSGFGYFASADAMGEVSASYAVFRNIIPGAPVDLEFSAVGDYMPFETAPQGLYGSFGILNVKANSSAAFRFRFKNADTDADYTMSPFRVTFMDLDSGAGRNSMDGSFLPCEESVTFSNLTLYHLNPLAKISVVANDGMTTFTSGEIGGNDGNPVYFGELDDQQRARMVTLEFPALSEFSITFSVGAGCHKARNVMFSKPVQIGFC